MAAGSASGCPVRPSLLRGRAGNIAGPDPTRIGKEDPLNPVRPSPARSDEGPPRTRCVTGPHPSQRSSPVTVDTRCGQQVDAEHRRQHDVKITPVRPRTRMRGRARGGTQKNCPAGPEFQIISLYGRLGHKIHSQTDIAYIFSATSRTSPRQVKLSQRGDALLSSHPPALVKAAAPAADAAADSGPAGCSPSPWSL
jgi:hypothetical protein